MSEEARELSPEHVKALDERLAARFKAAASKSPKPPTLKKPQSQGPIDKVLEALDKRGLHPEEKKAGEWMAQCPAHNDGKPSLSIKDDSDRVLLHCFAGCTTKKVVEALGLKMSDLFEGRGVVAIYDYADEQGELLYQVVRYDPKDFRARRPDGKGGWIHNQQGIRKVLYQLPHLCKLQPQSLVFVCEGEKDADRVIAEGLNATTCPFGAGTGKWLSDYNEPLRNMRVAILPDNDEAGEKHATQVARALKGVAAEIKVVRLPDLPEKGDVSDWMDKGGTKDDLFKLVEQTEPWKDEPQQADLLLFKPFPVEVIPEPVRTYITQGAKAIDCDPSYIALPLLAALASAIGNARQIELHEDWSEPSVLWTAIVGMSGTVKSPALKYALRPLHKMDHEAIQLFKKKFEMFQIDQKQYEAAAKKAKTGVLPPKPDRPPREPALSE